MTNPEWRGRKQTERLQHIGIFEDLLAAQEARRGRCSPTGPAPPPATRHCVHRGHRGRLCRCFEGQAHSALSYPDRGLPSNPSGREPHSSRWHPGCRRRAPCLCPACKTGGKLASLNRAMQHSMTNITLASANFRVHRYILVAMYAMQSKR